MRLRSGQRPCRRPWHRARPAGRDPRVAPHAKTELARISRSATDSVTCQAWGEQEPRYFRAAIRCGHKIERKDGSQTNLVWGWNAVALRIHDNRAYQDVFYDACYNMAQCHLNYALTKSDKEREEWLRQAEEDILAVLRLRPKMGGEKWYAKNDALLKNIQSHLDVPENQRGLNAAERNWAAAAKEKANQK